MLGCTGQSTPMAHLCSQDPFCWLGPESNSRSATPNGSLHPPKMDQFLTGGEDNAVARTRRTPRGFILDIERGAAGYTVHGSDSMLFFSDEGKLFAMARGMLTASEVNHLIEKVPLANDQDATVKHAMSHLASAGYQLDPDTALVSADRYVDSRWVTLIDRVLLRTGEDANNLMYVHIDAYSMDVHAIFPAMDQMNYQGSVKRTNHLDGDLENPTIITDAIYSRKLTTLNHDYFYIMDDLLCFDSGGNPVTLSGCPVHNCPDYPTHPDKWCEFAEGPGGDDYIGTPSRSGLDFHNVDSGWDRVLPEVYYWASNYMDWQDEALQRLGVVPPPDERIRALIVANSCQHALYENQPAKALRTEFNKQGDNNPRIYLPNYSFVSPPLGAGQLGGITADGTHGIAPVVIAHELNHFVLWRYVGINNNLLCDPDNPLLSNENGMIHEGVLGTVLPHLHWHSKYDVGYLPEPSSRLPLSTPAINPAGSVFDYFWVHGAGDYGFLTRSSEPCDPDDSGSRYRGGRVLGQALWKLFFGTDSRFTCFNWFCWWVPVLFTPLDNVDDFVEIAYIAAQSAADYSLEAYAYWFTLYAKFWHGIDDVQWCLTFENHGLDVRPVWFSEDCEALIHVPW